MKTAALIQSKFIRKQDVMDQPMVLTIADCTLEEGGRFRKGPQGVLWFMETDKGLGLNATKVKVLEAAYGPDTEAWENKRVRLTYDASVKMGDQLVGGIKLEVPRGGPAAPPGAPPPPVWDAVTQQWITQAPAPVLPAGVPPPPIWDPVSNQWVMPSVMPSSAPAPVPSAASGFGPPPQTIAQRMAAAEKAANNAGKPFDDDIPF